MLDFTQADSTSSFNREYEGYEPDYNIMSIYRRLDKERQ